MNAHTEKEFNVFMSQLIETNATLDFYCDFNKIRKNVAEIEISLNMLNYLLGQQDLRKAVQELWNRDKKVFEVLQILIAVRNRDKKTVITPDAKIVPLSSYLTSVDGIMEYLEGTGLAKVFCDKNVKNLVDYVFGVEAGLDTNARKNRSGDVMENLVESILKRKNVTYRKEVYSREFPAIAKALGNDEKRFDFVIYGNEKTYLMEVNFYSGGGSKLNEVARSYSDIAPKINAVDGFEFVWITDGQGWNSARNKLQEAYNIIPSILNLTTINDFLTSLK